MSSMDTTRLQLHFNQETNRAARYLETLLDDGALRNNRSRNIVLHSLNVLSVSASVECDCSTRRLFVNFEDQQQQADVI